MVTKAKAKHRAADADAIICLGDGRRYASTRVACRYGAFSQSRCFELLKQKRIRGKKFDRRILVDLDSIDELYANLPDR